MDKKHIIAVGGSGLVGSRIGEILGQYFSFENASIETGLDITKPETLSQIRNATENTWILHLAAKADVDGCEKDKPLGEQGPAWLINVEGTGNVLNSCKESGSKMIYISTDFIFDGQKPLGEGYKEEDRPNPINWYAKTKLEGEKLVKESGVPFLIVRIAYPFRKEFPGKLDFVRAIKTRLENKQSVQAVTDHVMSPTYIDDIGSALKTLIDENKTGIYHVVGSASVSPYEASLQIAEIFHLDPSLITQTKRDVFFQGRADRPFNLYLQNDKIKQLGVRMRSFQEGLQEMLD